MQLCLEDITKRYRRSRGVFSIRFTVQTGECVAIVGHNGAGKSTLLKILGGWLVPDSGTALVGGCRLSDRQSLVRNAGFVPEEPNLFESFSVEYNLSLFAALFALSASRVPQVMREFGLESFRAATVRNLSKGLKQRVSISRSLLPDPPVLLLDEPTSGLDFDMTREVHRLVKKTNLDGKTILFSSHRPEEIRALASRMIVLHKGGVVFDGTPERYFSSAVHRELYV
jgi:ABC-2 type transport system ATP-binding protein